MILPFNAIRYYQAFVMKTREKSLFTIGLIIGLGIGFVIGISVNFPKPNQSDLTGTFGKAAKFRKVQMTQKDVQLRSELLRDSAQLKSMIQGLLYFSLCADDVRSNVDLCILAFKARGMGSQAGEAAKIKALQDYSAFIANNNQTLNTTIGMLTGFYTNDTSGLSQDVEKSLRDFAGYVNGLNEKYQVLNEALSGFDNFMLTNKVLQSQKTEITQLKSIRDKLIVKGIQLGAAIGNDNQVHALIVAAFGSQEQFRAITAKDQIARSDVSARQDLQYADEVQAIAGLGVTGDFLNYNAPGASVILYDKPSQLFAYLPATAQQLNFHFTATPAIQVVATVGAQAIAVKFDNYSMQDVIGAMPGRFDAAANIFSMGDINHAFVSTEGLTGFINVSAREALGIVRGPNE